MIWSNPFTMIYLKWTKKKKYTILKISQKSYTNLENLSFFSDVPFTFLIEYEFQFQSK